jgi:hypothetical protein
MSQQQLFNIGVRLILSWIVLSILGYLFGREFIGLLLPYFEWCIGLITDDYSPSLVIRGSKDSVIIHLDAIALNPIWVHADLTVNPGAKLTSGTHLLHSLVPLVIMYSVLISWPVKNLQQRLLIIALSLPIMLMLLGGLIPFLLIGHIEMMLSDYAVQGGVSQPISLTLRWMLFTESGGRWIMALLASGLIIWFSSLPMKNNNSIP